MRLLPAVALSLITFAFHLRTIFVFRRMMNQVNGALPADSRIPEIGPSWLQGRVIKLHRQFFPDSTLRRELYALWWLTTAAFLSALACVVSFK